MHWLLFILGLTSPSSVPYLLWSGCGFVLLGAWALAYRRFTCNVPGCRRLGFKLQKLTGHSFCRIHDDIGKKEEAAKQRKLATGELDNIERD